MAAVPLYTRFAQWVARISGRPLSFAVVLLFTILWGLAGPLFHFNNTWQLAISTVSSIVTLLMVFIIQNTQNRQTEALQLKLDELIRATRGAHNALLDLEDLEDEQLLEFRQRYETLAHEARMRIHRGEADTDNDKDIGRRGGGQPTSGSG